MSLFLQNLAGNIRTPHREPPTESFDGATRGKVGQTEQNGAVGDHRAQG